MGTCNGKAAIAPDPGPDTTPTKEQEAAAVAKSKVIDLQMQKARETDEASLKLLLLGAGESGKSTIFKQIKQIYSHAYDSKDARRPFIRIIHHNIVQAIKTLVEQTNALNIPVEQSAVNSAKYIAESVRLEDAPTPSTFRHIKVLWKDKGIRQCFDLRSRFQLIDTCDRLFDRIDEIASDQYVPSYEDILHARARTSGITETSFEEKGNRFVLLDVGGQKNERKKWIHSFEGVTAVIFVVGMSEYDQLMFEDLTTNRMHDTLALFDEICNLKWFKTTAMLIFLNKRDLFQDKIKRVDMNVCFPEYKGGLQYESAVRFLVDKFNACNRVTKKRLYFHVTCATDTSNVAFTFNACKSIIIEHGLRHAGLVT